MGISSLFQLSLFFCALMAMNGDIYLSVLLSDKSPIDFVLKSEKPLCKNHEIALLLFPS